MSKYTSITACRLCQSAGIETIIDFGNVPLANSYPTSKGDIEDYYPLTLLKCASCGHVQLKETVSPKVLFSEYAYASSDSPSLLSHFEEYASSVVKRLGLGEYDSVLEIGSNDGILLKKFISLGLLNVHGVEPAKNIAERSLNIGATIHNCFFGKLSADEILLKHGKMKVICANNVFAHVADVDSVMNGVVHLLSKDGVFIFENAYLLDTIKGLYFDQVYAEHLQYYGIKPLVQYLSKYKMEIFHIDRVSTQGGSFRIYCKFDDNQSNQVDESVSLFLKEEDSNRLYETSTYDSFLQKIKLLSFNIKDLIEEKISEGKTFSCYGCPAKFALFSKVFGLHSKNIKYVVDDSSLKIGKYSPGKKIPIVSKKHFVDNPTDFCIISAWNMSDSIRKNNKQYMGNWVIPMPKLKII